MTTTIRRRAALAAAAVAATLAATLAGAGTSAAAPGDCDAQYTLSPQSYLDGPRTLVVGLSDLTRRVTVTGGGQAAIDNGCTYTDWAVEGPGFSAEGERGQSVVTTVDSDVFGNASVGSHAVVITLRDDNAGTSAGFDSTVYVKRRTAWTNNQSYASPEQVEAGANVTVRGTLQRANLDTNTYQPYAGRFVRVQFRSTDESPSVSGVYHSVATGTTSSTGAVSVVVDTDNAGVQRDDGGWRLSYGGNSGAGAAAARGDLINVFTP